MKVKTMKIISTLYKIFIMLLFLFLALFFYKTESNIVANISHFKIYTSFFAITVIVSLFIFVYMFLILPLIKMFRRFIHKRTTKQIIHLMTLFNITEEQEILTVLLTNTERKKDIKIIKNIKLLMTKGNYNKAISYIARHPVSQTFFFIQQYYLCIAYAAKNETHNLVATLEKAIHYSKNYNYWFLKILIQENQKYPVIEQLLFLNEKFHVIKFPSKDHKKKYFCILLHLIIDSLIKANKEAEAQTYISKIITTYPDYTPIYEYYFHFNKKDMSQKQIVEVLEKAWINNPSYLSITLWVKYFDIENTDLENSLNHLSKNDIYHYNLLIASLYIKQDHLIKSAEYLEKVNNSSIDKSLVEVSLFAQERDYKKLMECINNLIKYTEVKYWWN